MTTSRHAGPPVATPPARPVWPPRDGGAQELATHEPGPHEPGHRPGPHGPAPAAPSAPPPHEELLADEPPDLSQVPPEERPLDPRAIARASLAAGRNVSLFWTVGGVAVSVGAAFLCGVAVGACTLALLLVVVAVARAVLPSPGPAAIGVRSKGLDLAMLLLSAVALVVLALAAPTA